MPLRRKMRSRYEDIAWWLNVDICVEGQNCINSVECAERPDRGTHHVIILENVRSRRPHSAL